LKKWGKRRKLGRELAGWSGGWAEGGWAAEQRKRRGVLLNLV
jgi:hypothetical protein